MNAIVTGASSGIGFSVAARLLRDNWKVLGTARSAVPAEFRSEANLCWRAINLVTSDGIQALCEHASAEFQDGVDIVVHCAAEFRAGALTFDECEAMARMNLIAPYILCHRIEPALRRGGMIVLVSSVAATCAQPDAEFYGATKAAIDSLVASLAYRFGPADIRVLGVAPGLVSTAMSQRVCQDIALRSRIESQTPFSRIAMPEDIGDLICWLYSKDTRWLTGQVLRADGGRSLGSYETIWDESDMPRNPFAKPRSK